MRVFRFLRDGGVLYTLGLTVKCIYGKIRGCFPAQRLEARRANRTKGKGRSDCIWRPASSRW
jgi:hypothetical protein